MLIKQISSCVLEIISDWTVAWGLPYIACLQDTIIIVKPSQSWQQLVFNYYNQEVFFLVDLIVVVGSVVGSASGILVWCGIFPITTSSLHKPYVIVLEHSKHLSH